MLIDDFKPELGELVLVHDLGARLACLVDGFNQVGDLHPYGVARHVVIKVHVEEEAGHRQTDTYGQGMRRRRREAEDPASVDNDWQSDHAGTSQPFDRLRLGNSGNARH